MKTYWVSIIYFIVKKWIKNTFVLYFVGKTDKKEKFAALNTRLKSVEVKLEAAQRSGIEAEKILLQVSIDFLILAYQWVILSTEITFKMIQAELQGQKEAAMYTKALAQVNKDAKVAGKWSLISLWG